MHSRPHLPSHPGTKPSTSLGTIAGDSRGPQTSTNLCRGYPKWMHWPLDKGIFGFQASLPEGTINDISLSVKLYFRCTVFIIGSFIVSGAVDQVFLFWRTVHVTNYHYWFYFTYRVLLIVDIRFSQSVKISLLFSMIIQYQDPRIVITPPSWMDHSILCPTRDRGNWPNLMLLIVGDCLGYIYGITVHLWSPGVLTIFSFPQWLQDAYSH